MAASESKASVTPLAGSLGVRLDGVDVADDCSPQLVDALRTILDEHLVIHLPGQAALITHMEQPPSVSILVGREIPSVGGDTQWANQYAAYDALSRGLRDTIDDLYAVHEGTFRADAAGLDHEAVTSVHPVVVTHDRTGRRALFVNANYTTRFDGWTAEESSPLLEYLFRAAVRSELTCRHRWTVGDMMIWDNRATQHAAIGDAAPGEPRILHRVTIAGAVPR